MAGLATALALIGCAMLGTAGAYAYRSYASPTGTAQTPPIITADKSTPTKILAQATAVGHRDIGVGARGEHQLGDEIALGRLGAIRPGDRTGERAAHLHPSV